VLAGVGRRGHGVDRVITVEFRVLGPLRVVDGDRAVALGGPMQRAVLAVLVVGANRVVSMQQLVHGLWGDDPPVRAVGTVQAYVSNLRRALEPRRRRGEPARVLVWRAPGYLLRVDPEDVDWLRFEWLVGQARQAHVAGDLAAADTMLADALALWRGPPLADLDGVAVHERARLDGLRLSAVEEHAEVLLALGRHGQVVDDLGMVAAEHPLRERLRGLQMIALYRAGRQVEALDVYTEVRRRLADEHGLDPGGELRHLHEQVLRQDPALDPVRPGAGHAADSLPGAVAPFVGRDAEVAALRAHLDATAAGSGRVVLVEGEPGIGKTRLAEEVATDAAARGFLVVWGRCTEGGGAPPLWPWAQILRAAGDDRNLADLVAQQTRLDPQAARGQLNQTLTDLLRDQASAQPLLLVLDDLPWADEPSLELLEFLAAQLPDVRILVLGTYREVDLPHAGRLTSTLGVLARLPGADRVALRGLDVDDVAHLIRAHTGAKPDAGIARAVHRRTEGNPFFVTELLRLDDPAGLAQGPVPAGVRDVLRRRVARLTPATRALLDTAALIGRDVDLQLVGGLCGLDCDTCLQAAEAAVVDGLLAVVADKAHTYRFTHALVHQTLAGDLSPVHQARLRERIGRALLDTYGEDDEHAGQVAEHLWAALPVGDVERTLRAQARAADVAWAGLAHEQAEMLLERASTLLQSPPPVKVTPDVDLGIHLRLGSLRTARHGYTPAAREAFDRARLMAEQLDRRAELLTALSGLAATAVVRGDLAAAGELTDAALAQARHIPDPAALASGYLGVGIVAFYRGQLARARQHFAAVSAAWRDAGSAAPAVLRGPPASARPDVMAASYDALAACLMGDAAGATRQIGRASHTAEGAGEPYLVAFVHSFHARLAALARDRHAARQAGTRAIDVAEANGFPLLAEHAAIPLGWAQAGNGEPRAGLETIHRAMDALYRRGQRILIPFHQGLQAEVLLTLGDPAAALALLDDALAESATRGGGFETPGLHHLRGLALDALGRGDQAQAARAAAATAAHEQGARNPNLTSPPR
jgi:DNA-binding SARP family transcriptional activator/tetratricopeptide (TPR) repeat protein